jgi:mannose-6-phosphate isomerase-like protein (cupin superfamily)
MTPTVAFFPATQDKGEIVAAIRAMLDREGFRVVDVDATRPWGAFFRIDNAQADRFIDRFFGPAALPESARRGERSPKLLLVAPGMRLSWQYHDRRSEVWRVASGQVGVATSDTDEEPPETPIKAVGEQLQIPQGTRHRLIGLEDWGVVAEIWIHTDPACPSNESDVHRLQDDFGRDDNL